jgi:hypothetical protein
MNNFHATQRLRVLVLGLLLGFAAGCSEQKPAPPPTPATALASRLGAAEAIFDSGKRDDALRAVAEAAAGVGEVKVVKRALQGIFDSTQRDAAAAAAAVALAKTGKPAEAKEIALTIFDSSKRDETLAKLAKG